MASRFTESGVSGVQVYDARLAAVMHVHGINLILTLNVTDFSRFEGLIALHPESA
jgi:predicted nucleic acid-binding protein